MNLSGTRGVCVYGSHISLASSLQLSCIFAASIGHEIHWAEGMHDRYVPQAPSVQDAAVCMKDMIK